MKRCLRCDKLVPFTKCYKLKLYCSKKCKDSEYYKKRKQGYPPTRRFGVYQRSAKKRGHEFNLKIDVFLRLLDNSCYYCGGKEKIGIDRVNNDIGYIEDNVKSCCKDCNYLKARFSYEKFITLCKKIADNLKNVEISHNKPS